MRHLLHFVFIIVGITSLARGQSSFRQAFEKANPVTSAYDLRLEEKVQLHQEFLDQAIRQPDTLKQLYGYLYLFIDYLRAHDYAEASRYLLEAEDITQKSKHPGWQGMLYHLQGVLAVRLKDHAGAIPYYEKAVEFCGKGGDSLCVAESLEQLGSMHGKLSNFEEAQHYFDQAFPLIEKYGGEITLSTSLNNYGLLLLYQDRLAEASTYIKRSIAINEQHGRHKEQAQGMNNLADIYLRLGQVGRAIETWDAALKLNQAYELRENMITNYIGLYNAYSQQGDNQTANHYLIKHYELRDSIIGVQTRAEIAELQLKYERTQSDLELKKGQAELEATESQLKIRSLLLLGLVLLIAALIWRWRAQVRRTQREHAQHKENLNSLVRILLEKNRLLRDMEAEAAEISAEKNAANNLEAETATSVEGLEQKLYNQRILTDEDSAAFKQYFEKSFPGYLLRLRNTFPDMTEAEERLFLFIKVNLTSKEAAAILGISAESVKKTRHRLRKRLDLLKGTSLEVYVRNF